MASNTKIPPPAAPHGTAPLIDALHQSEQVHDKVEQAAEDLAAVNAVMQEEVVDAPQPLNVKRALRQSESVEVRVQEAAAELVTVNDALAREIDERHHLESQLSASATALSKSQAEAKSSDDRALHDPITGLPNLTLFNDRLKSALAQSERHGWRLAVMFIDLDGFKTVNDTHGHDAGDRVLQLVAARLQNIVRKGDTVCRRSGDEFLFLMLEAGDDDSIEALAVRMATKIREPCQVEGGQVTVGASIGIAVYSENGGTPEELLKNADSAMYAAKATKTTFAFYGRVPLPHRPGSTHGRQ